MTNDELTKVLESGSTEEIGFAFGELAEQIVEHTPFREDDSDISDFKQEMILIALQKLPKFSSKKGKAFNYFTTIMLCHARQLYRKQRDYNTLKERFRLRNSQKATT